MGPGDTCGLCGGPAEQDLRQHPLKIAHGKIRLQVMAGSLQSFNNLTLCHACIREIVVKGEMCQDWPKAVKSND